MTLAQRLFKNTTYLISSHIAGNILLFFFVVFLGRAYGESGVGKYSFAFSFVFVYAMFAYLGIDTYLVREIAKKKGEDRKIVFHALIVRIVNMCIFCFLLVLTIFIYQNIFDREKIILISLFVGYQIFFLLADIFVSEFKAHERMGGVAILNIMMHVIIVGTCILLISANCSLVTVLSIWPVGALVYFILTLVYSLSNYGLPSFKGIHLKDLLHFYKAIIPFGIMVIITELISRKEILILSLIKGDAEAGIYTVAFKIAAFIFVASNFIHIAILPTLTHYFFTSKDRLIDICSRIIKYLFMISIPISTGFCILSDDILKLLYGDRFTDSANVLKILAWLIVIRLILGFFESFLVAIHKQMALSYILSTGLFAGLILNFIFVPHLSYYGASLAIVISSLIILVLYILYIYQQFAYLPFLKHSIRPGIASSVMAAVIFVIPKFNLFLTILLGFFVYAVGLLVLGGFERKDINILKEIFLGQREQTQEFDTSVEPGGICREERNL